MFDKVEQHINLLSKIGRVEPEKWFPIYLEDYEHKIMEESPYYVHHLECIDNNAFSIDLAKEVYSIRNYFLGNKQNV